MVFKTKDRENKNKPHRSERQSYVVVRVNIHLLRTYSLAFFREILIIIQFISFTAQFSMKNPVGESYYKMAYFLCTKFDYSYVFVSEVQEKSYLHLAISIWKKYSSSKTKRKMLMNFQRTLLSASEETK